MSITLKFPIAMCAAFFLLAAPAVVFAQGDAPATVRIEITDSAEADVAVDLAPGQGSPRRSLSFLTSYAGIGGLENRIKEVRTFGTGGGEIANRYSGSGVYFADGAIASVRYKVDLSPPADTTLAAHVSWFGCGSGALMLLDLLPAEAVGDTVLKMSFAVPDGFYVSFPPSAGKDGIVGEPRDAVFMVLPHSTRRLYAQSAGIDFGVFVTGEWQFSEARLVKMTSDLLEEYKDLFGSGPGGEIIVNMVPVPCAELRGRWRAETRGRNVLVLSSPAAYKNLGEQLAHEQLRHELLHLWVPNRLRLDGDYAWFYEGFVFYRALIAGVSLGQIRFEDVLKTLSTARSRAGRADRWRPLAGSDADRWGAESGTDYSRWVMTAFAADVLLNSRSGGNIDRVLRDVFRKASQPGPKRGADEFLISELSRHSELSGLVKGSVSGKESPEWDALFSLAGLESGSNGLTPVARPTRRQKAFLKRLGYNVRR